MKIVTLKRIALAVIAVFIGGFVQVAQADDSTWGGTGSTNTNDFTLNTNWLGDTLPVGGMGLIDDGGDHNPVMDSAFDTNILTTSSGTNSLTSPFALTGNGTMTMSGDSSGSYIANAANFDFTVDIASLVITGRGTYLVSGDYTSSSEDAGVGNLVLGHAGGPMTITYTYGGTSANRTQIVAHNAGPLGDVGTSIIVYPKLDFSAASGSSSSYIQLRPESLSTIQLLGGITGSLTPPSGNPTRLVRTNGQVGGKTILGDSSDWVGFMRIETSDLEINSDNSLGTTDGYTEIQSGANTGALRLTNGITVADLIYPYSRDTTDYPQIRNISGSNTLVGDLVTDSTFTGYSMINSDGNASGDLLTIQGNILRTGDGSGELILQGAGNGVVTGDITQYGSGVWNSVTKAGAGTWTLTGYKNYFGDTVVKEGTLSIDSTFLPDAADVYLATDAFLNLDFPADFPDVIDSLFIDSVPQAIGTWGATGSGADHETSWITGTGLLQVSTLGVLEGDYNLDGVVDAADYVLWRKDPGSYGGDPDGYVAWRANFGAGSVPGAGAGSGGIGAGGAAVPEPATCGLLLCAMLGLLSGRRSTTYR